MTDVRFIVREFETGNDQRIYTICDLDTLTDIKEFRSKAHAERYAAKLNAATGEQPR